jgi:hypothetical protein
MDSATAGLKGDIIRRPLPLVQLACPSETFVCSLLNILMVEGHWSDIHSPFGTVSIELALSGYEQKSTWATSRPSSSEVPTAI